MRLSRSDVIAPQKTTFTWGRVGSGSFDDIGDFADMRIKGFKAEQAPKPANP